MPIEVQFLEHFYILDYVALIFSTISFVSLPIYLIVLYVIYKGRKHSFTGPFYIFFLFLGIYDIISILVNILGNNLPAWGITDRLAYLTDPWYARIYFAVAWLTRVNQGFSSGLISINRVSSIIWPLRYSRIWTPERLKYFVAVQTVPGILFAIVIAFYRIEYIVEPGRPFRRVSFNFKDPEWHERLYSAAGVLDVLLAGIILISYNLTLCCLSKMVNGKEKAATRLGLGISVIELLYFVYMIVAVLFTIPTMTYFSIHSIMCDLYSTFNLYLLLFTSSAIRKELLSVFCFLPATSFRTHIGLKKKVQRKTILVPIGDHVITQSAKAISRRVIRVHSTQRLIFLASMILPLDVGAMLLSISAVLTLPLYGSLTRLLLKERSVNFSGSFYDLFILLSLLDMVAIVVNFIGVSLTGWGLTSSVAGLWYGKIYVSLAWLTRGTSSALIAVNRAYAMIIPLQYAKIWRRGRVRKLQLLQILPGFIFAGTIVTFDVEYQSFNTTLRQVTPRITNDLQISFLYKAAGVLEVVLILIIGLSYGSGIVSILKKKYQKSQDNTASKKKSRAEMSATYMGVSICCLEFAYFLYSAFSVFNKIPANTYFSLHSSLTDIYSSLNCYLLLAFSKSVRRRLLMFWRLPNGDVGVSTMATKTVSVGSRSISRVE